MSLAPEGGAHQSIGTPLIGISQDGIAAFEPAFVDELAAILGWSFDYLQRSGEGLQNERNWLRDETGGSVYLRLSTRPLEQPSRTLDAELKRAIVDGAYWLREPGPNPEIIVAYQGAVAPEAIEAVGLMGEDRRDVGLLAITSADRLNAGWTAAQRARERGLAKAESHIERLLASAPRNCALVTVVDGHPSHAWLARRGAWPPHARARRGAFRPVRLDRRSLSALRHRRGRDFGGGGGDQCGQADKASADAGVIRSS